jgi:hypothetical protein
MNYCILACLYNTREVGTGTLSRFGAPERKGKKELENVKNSKSAERERKA